MSTVHSVLRFLRTLEPFDGATDTADEHLLARFVAARDEASFALLLRRHGPMVMGVCLRVLGNSSDAEDAFQATFLVLVRRAHAVGRPELLANWLHGVAYRTALKARAAAFRRRHHECRVTGPTEAEEACSGLLARDLRPVLEEELSRLPTKYRVPVVLCYLEGQSHEEIARRLCCPRATVTTRLSRARERLRRRMLQRGVALSATALTTLFAPAAVTAAIPAQLFAETVKAAILAAAGQAVAAGVISARVAALTEGVLHAMWLMKLKLGTLVVLGIAILAGAAGLLARQAFADEQLPRVEQASLPATPEPAPAPLEEQDDKATVQSMPPVVVKTVPQAGDIAVDAATTTEIRVTFSKDMTDKSWSWSQISSESFPKTTGKARYDKDKRTCILPVKLEPGRTYVIWLNPQKFQGFRDATGKPAAFYPLVFETKP